MEKFIQTIARRAGEVILQKFGNVQHVRTKANATDVVSEADLAANKILISAIRKKFPTHGIVSEETKAYHDHAQYVWYIDPLDGSFNFVRGTPIFCTMIGVAHKDKMLLSVIYDPTLKYLYFAKRNKGAFLNGKRIYCSKQKTWENSYGSGPSQLRSKEKIAFVKRLTDQAVKTPFWLSSLGSIGITAGYVAQGARDFVATAACGVYESAAASLLLQEAGCRVTAKDGRPWQVGNASMIAANKYLYPKLLQLVQGK